MCTYNLHPLMCALIIESNTLVLTSAKTTFLSRRRLADAANCSIETTHRGQSHQRGTLPRQAVPTQSRAPTMARSPASYKAGQFKALFIRLVYKSRETIEQPQGQVVWFDAEGPKQRAGARFPKTKTYVCEWRRTGNLLSAGRAGWGAKASAPFWPNIVRRTFNRP
jgi:hypothetical protein